MKILFVHQSFPGQFKFLAPELAARGHEVRALQLERGLGKDWMGVSLDGYQLHRGTSTTMHPWIVDIEAKVIRGEAAYRAALAMRESGFVPEVIIAHPGWGESLFLKDVWPTARLGIYCEFFYHGKGADVGFDPEFPSPDAVSRMRIKNANNLLHMEIADAGISPTHWQASTFPERFRSRIRVIHDGIDTQQLKPDPTISIRLNEALLLTKADEVITFVNRNLEPYRGYHIFMRALPAILRQRPNARVLIVGGDEVSYGAKPESGCWKDIFLREVLPQLGPEEQARLYFLGSLPYAAFIGLLQLSSVHVYLTYPFVLSWSLLEAMSVGCAIVASDTAPLREAIFDGETGRLVDFFDVDALSTQVCELLANPEERQRLGRNAREFAVEHYDLKTVCLPEQIDWVMQLAQSS